MTFVSILDDNPSALIHIEKAPVSSFGCFSQNAITIIIEKLVELLRKGTIFVIADLLLNLDRNKLIPDTVITKIRYVAICNRENMKSLTLSHQVKSWPRQKPTTSPSAPH